jgi:hypothetical protein
MSVYIDWQLGDEICVCTCLPEILNLVAEPTEGDKHTYFFRVSAIIDAEPCFRTRGGSDMKFSSIPNRLIWEGPVNFSLARRNKSDAISSWGQKDLVFWKAVVEKDKRDADIFLKSLCR